MPFYPANIPPSAPEVNILAELPDRDSLLVSLLRETDRVQRTSSPLCIVLFEIDDLAHIEARFDGDLFDQLLCSVASRTIRLLRTYDLLGRPGSDAFLIGLPGCSLRNAVLLAERIRADVFGPCFNLDGEPVFLTASIGIASSQGRSPLVVLREAERALQRARVQGPDSLQCVYDGQISFAVESPRNIEEPSDSLSRKR